MFGNQNSLNWAEINDQDCLHYWVRRDGMDVPKKGIQNIESIFRTKKTVR